MAQNRIYSAITLHVRIMVAVPIFPTIQDRWAHSFLVPDGKGGFLVDASGKYVQRQVGWGEHLLRNVGGYIQELSGFKNTLSPDSPDSPGYAQKRGAALEDSKAYLQKFENALKENQTKENKAVE